MVQRGIRKAWELSVHLDLGEVFSNPVSLEASDGFKRLCRASDVPYKEVYLAGLRYGDYNFQLRDFSYFQFSESQDGDLRFAYYPNPMINASGGNSTELLELQEFLQEGVIDIEEYLALISELNDAQHPPLVRYEYCVDQYVEFSHPCSHFHIGHHVDSRWPASRILTPEGFTAIALKLFYRRAWLEAGEFNVNGETIPLERLYSAYKSECRILPTEHFSEGERRQFYWE